MLRGTKRRKHLAYDGKEPHMVVLGTGFYDESISLILLRRIANYGRQMMMSGVCVCNIVTRAMLRQNCPHLSADEVRIAHSIALCFFLK